MENDIQSWLEQRRSTVHDHFTLPQNMQTRFEDLMTRMTDLAAECQDQGEFEKRMSTTLLNTEYNEFLSSITQYANAHNTANPKSTAGNMAGGITSNAVMSWINRLLPGNLSMYDLRNISSLLTRFFKRK